MKKIILFLLSFQVIFFAAKNVNAKKKYEKKEKPPKRIVLKKSLIKGDIDNTLKIPLITREKFYYMGPEIIINRLEKKKKIETNND